MTADKRARMSDEEMRASASQARGIHAPECPCTTRGMHEDHCECSAYRENNFTHRLAEAVEQLLAERDEARELLGKMLCIIDHGRAYSCGRCGEPGAICDDDCATATYQAQDIHRARTLAK